MSIPPGLDGHRSERAIRLLADAGPRGPFRWTRLMGGANNRVFRVDAANQTVMLKAYFVHPDDPRDRLRADYGFSRFAWQCGVRALARPIACDPEVGLGLFEYVRGRKLAPAEATHPRVREALEFFRALNAWRDTEDARTLPAASEACFTFEQHLDCARRRVARLHAMEPGNALERETQAFIQGELSDRVDAVLDHVRDQALMLGLAPTEPLPAEDRCLSPSDFGFHNALLCDDGRLRFIDFEYAGWDDPAKTVVDFFCQPERPAPPECFEEFASTVAGLTSEPDLHRQRSRLLLPVHRLKWCCILLNDFLPCGGRRRGFAHASRPEARKAGQLAKARAALRNLCASAEVIHG